MVKGKITDQGVLHLCRAGIYKPVICPRESQGILYCNDSCALFGDPIPALDKSTQFRIGSILQLCTKSILFDSFIDEREDQDNGNVSKSKQ